MSLLPSFLLPGTTNYVKLRAVLQQLRIKSLGSRQEKFSLSPLLPFSRLEVQSELFGCDGVESFELATVTDVSGAVPLNDVPEPAKCLTLLNSSSNWSSLPLFQRELDRRAREGIGRATWMALRGKGGDVDDFGGRFSCPSNSSAVSVDTFSSTFKQQCSDSEGSPMQMHLREIAIPFSLDQADNAFTALIGNPTVSMTKPGLFKLTSVVDRYLRPVPSENLDETLPTFVFNVGEVDVEEASEKFLKGVEEELAMQEGVEESSKISVERLGSQSRGGQLSVVMSGVPFELRFCSMVAPPTFFLSPHTTVMENSLPSLQNSRVVLGDEGYEGGIGKELILKGDCWVEFREQTKSSVLSRR